MREIELKFTAGPVFSLDAVQGRADVESAEELDPHTLTSTYYDTSDLRLARNGVTLRFRTGEAEPLWTVKLPRTRTDATVRDELSFPGGPEAPPTEATDLVVGHARTETLLPVATLVTQRRRWRLLGTDGDVLAVVYDDDVSVIERGRTLTRFREVELESAGVELEDLKVIGAALTDAGAVPSETVPKAVRALGPRATAPSDLPVIGGAPPAAASDAIQRMFTRAAHRITSHHAAVRLGDPEGVHQMRVGIRRLRSDLRTFAPLVDVEWAAPVMDDLKWLATALGNVRDGDVFAQRLDEQAADLAPHLGSLYSALEADRSGHRQALHELLRSDRYRLLLETLVRAAQNAPIAYAAPSEVEAMVALVRPAWQRLRRAARSASRGPDDNALHRLRIQTKRVRYAIEALEGIAPISSSEHRRFVRRAAGLQQVLGEHQDAVVSQAKVRAHATGGLDGGLETMLALGRLIEREHVTATNARRRWSAAWQRLDAKRVTRWLAE